jgi:fluoride exporter
MNPTLAKLLLIAAGGAVGAVSRYALSGVVQNRAAESTFPWGTMVVNVAGCLAIGFLWILIAEKSVLSPRWQLLLATGLLGAFTTFSTFSLETVELINKGQWLTAGGNVAGSVVLGLAAVVGGMALARAI